MELKDFRFRITDKKTNESCVIGFEDLACDDLGIYIRTVLEDEESNIPTCLSGRMLLRNMEYCGGIGYKTTDFAIIDVEDLNG